MTRDAALVRIRPAAVALTALLMLVAAACSSYGSDGTDPTSAVPTATTTVPATTTTVPVRYTAEVVEEIVVDSVYRQGLARVENGWIFSFNDGLFVTDDAFTQTTTLVPAIPDEWKARGFEHIGDIDVEGGVLYAPLEQPDYELGEQAMLVYDSATLAYTAGVTVAQHENSFVAVDATTGIAYTLDRFGGDALLRYDVADGWRELEPLPMSAFVDRVQGGDVFDGAIWLSTDDATDGVYRVDLETGEVQSLGSIGRIDGEGEGIDATPLPGGDLHVLTIDVEAAPVRLIELRVIPA